MGFLETLGSVLPSPGSILNFASDMITNRQNLRLQHKAWDREDSAVQRRVADLKAAGLSPTLAAGSAASTMGPIRLQAPQVSSSMLDVQAQRLAVQQGQAAVERTRAETDLARQQALRSRAETAGQEIANALATQRNPLLLEREGMDTAIMRATQQARIDEVLRRAEGLGLENTLKRLDAGLKSIEGGEKAVRIMEALLRRQLIKEQISGLRAEVAVKAATLDMLAEREKAYTASAERDRAITKKLEKESEILSPVGSVGTKLDEILRWIGLRGRK